MAAVVGPLAAGAMGTATGGMVAAGTMTANTATFISAASGAVAAGAATNATVSVINNRGNLGAVFKDVTSSDAMKGYVISGVTAGLTAAYFDGWTGTKTEYGTGNITSPPLNTWTGVGQFAASQTLQNGTSMLVGKALGQGGSGSDALKSALFNTLAAVSFNAVGDYTKGRLAEGYPPKIIVHAMVGGLLAEATGGDFKTGALAAGVNEAVVGHLSSLVHGDKTLLSMSSQVIGVLAAATQKDADAESLEKGGWVAKNATQYNHSLHEMQTVALDELRRRDPESKAKYDAAACALTHCMMGNQLSYIISRKLKLMDSLVLVVHLQKLDLFSIARIAVFFTSHPMPLKALGIPVTKTLQNTETLRLIMFQFLWI